MAPTEKALLLAEIKLKMSKAERGLLTFGRGRHYDVDQIEAWPNVLEIRVRDHSGIDPADPEAGMMTRHTRVYFTEPEELPNVLLMLRVASKRPGPEGKTEQNEAAGRASRLADEHCRRPDVRG